MFVAVYSFHIKPGLGAVFEKSWKNLTKLIYNFEGSLGSRLHKQKSHHYIAYARPDKAAREKAGNNMPDKSSSIRKTMKDSCEKTETLFELEVVDNLLKTEVKP